MQAVILAAGRGTRMVELTESVPKPMLDVLGKPLLEYKLEALPEEIDEVIIIVGYLGSVIQTHFGGGYAGRSILYVEQEELDGTAGALWKAKDLLHDRFLVMMGDDIYAREDIEACISPADNVWRLVVQQLPELFRAGRIELDDNGRIDRIIESSKEDELRHMGGLASTNMYLLDTRIFDQPPVPKHEGSLEYGLPQTAVAAAHALGITFEPVYTDQWIQITSPKDLITAADILGKIKKES
jgi:NDP-sugar pyrophosphorylase family protein